jgi:hypothetical protein
MTMMTFFTTSRFVGLVFQSSLLTALFNQRVFLDSTKSIPEQGSAIE